MVDVSDWYVQLSEPVRSPPHRLYDYFFSRNVFPFFHVGERTLDWLRLLSEPVRRKKPLPQGAIPYLFFDFPHLSYRFNLTELGDTGRFTFTTYPAKDLAKVTITEVKVEETPVIINEIRYDRGYS